MLKSIAGLSLIWVQACCTPGQEIDLEPDASRPVLTNIWQIWELPAEQRDLPHRVRTEVTVYFHDPHWDVAWGECNGVATFLPLAGLRTGLAPGQKVAIDGVIVPRAQRPDWEKTQLRVVAQNVELKPEPVTNLFADPGRMKGKLVLVEGLLDTQTSIDANHLALNLLAGETAATVYVLVPQSVAAPRFKPGDFIRLKGIYVPQFDADGNLSELVLWVSTPEDIEPVGSLGTDPRFALPLTKSADILPHGPTNQMVRVEGTVRRHEPGKWIAIWDGTGLVTVSSKQLYPVRIGDRIEAIGYPDVIGVDKRLRRGLYRLQSPDKLAGAQPDTSPVLPLRAAEQVRYLSEEEAGRGLPVELRGVVTWWHKQTGFAYIEDASGGVQVLNPHWVDPDSWKPGTIVILRGETCAGEYAPAITNAVAWRDGWWALGPGKPITLEQAMTGAEDGRWIEISGYVRSVNYVDGLINLRMSTSTGEFDVWTPATHPLDWLKGSIVRVRGVCAAVANKRRQLTGIQVFCPEPGRLIVEVPAPEDPFAVPQRAIVDLRRFNMESALHKRVRTSGTVTLHVPGQYLYIQDANEGLLILSEQTEPLQLGEVVDVVGFPGNQGRRFLLREAVYRRTGRTNALAPIQLTQYEAVNADLEGLLVRSEGTLAHVVNAAPETQLLIQTAHAMFRAILDQSDARSTAQLQRLPRGARVAITGVYEVNADEYGKPRAFILRLRGPTDVSVLKKPPVWTTPRLKRVALGTGVLLLGALCWNATMARKNRELQLARAALQAANAELEERVRERTRELQDQVAAKEQAYKQLEQAQQSLMQASRRAGMAEVATSVLHNVGNVLNSVNISISMLNERLQQLRVENVTRAAQLLKKPSEELSRFLTDDPKGRSLPEYLEKLGETLTQDKHALQAEVKTLMKSVEHIKVIVSMQQSLAKKGGVLEQVDITELVEDAIQVTAPAYDRHQIELVKEYGPVEPVLVDRHLVMQILINLLTNAKQALMGKTSDKKVIVQVSMPQPDKVRVSVTDNGIGIPPENLDKIFTQGFTTRPDGHGFGLHSGANAAKQLGGSLTAYSKGPGHGATFTLELPVGGPKTLKKIAKSDTTVLVKHG
ncbi:MAG: HAMP domain-containing histidine kinase [Verrucomicrobiae bacterium]|nr:HAMP domain-containing histidine kinase [Verrucomicrobiae bacterium]